MDKYLLCVAGASVDYFYRADSFPNEGDFTHATSLGFAIGGCPINMGAVAAKKNVKAKVLDMLGSDDESTTFILEELKKLNLDIENVYVQKDVQNGKVLIINTKDLRTMFVIDPIRPCYVVDDKIQSLLNNATYIYSLLHIFNRSFASIEPLLEAKKHGAKIIIDGTSKYDDPKRLEMLYALADGMFINETDFERLKQHSKDDPRKIIFNNGGEFVVVTNGSKGSTLYTKDQEIFMPSVKNLNVVDSTGAGDSFAGCFIASLINGYSYREALRYATLNGAFACTVFGSTGGVCTYEQLEKFAQDYHYGE